MSHVSNEVADVVVSYRPQEDTNGGASDPPSWARFGAPYQCPRVNLKQTKVGESTVLGVVVVVVDTDS